MIIIWIGLCTSFFSLTHATTVGYWLASESTFVLNTKKSNKSKQVVNKCIFSYTKENFVWFTILRFKFFFFKKFFNYSFDFQVEKILFNLHYETITLKHLRVHKILKIVLNIFQVLLKQHYVSYL